MDEVQQDVARLHRVLAGLYKRHPELFPLKKTETAVAEIKPKKEAPYIPLIGDDKLFDQWLQVEMQKEAKAKAIETTGRVLPRRRK